MKFQDYKDGEIHVTHSGSYIFVRGNVHSGPYSSVPALQHAVSAQDPFKSLKAKIPRPAKTTTEPVELKEAVKTSEPANYTETIAKNGRVQYRKNGKLISKKEYEAR